MRDAYSQGHIRSLWQRLQSNWQRSQVCSSELDALNQGIATYVRLPAVAVGPNSMVISNPLMPVGSGVTCVYADNHFVMLIGPTRNEHDRDVLITHELTHPVLNQLFRHNPHVRLALAESQCVFDHVLEEAHGAILTRYVYNTWESYLSEIMVRSISHRVTRQPEPISSAFVLAPHVGASLNTYERSTGTFVEAAVHTMQGLRRERCAQRLIVSRPHGGGRHIQRFSRQ